MNRKLIVLVIAAFIFAAPLVAQVESPEWTVEKSYCGGLAKWRIENVSVDKVWTAIMRSAMFIKKGRANGDRPSGTVVISVPGARIRTLLTPNDLAVDIIAEWEFEGGEKVQLRAPYSQAKRFFDVFFPKVKEALKVGDGK